MSAGTGNLPNQNMDFVPLATLPAADLDKLVDNIESLADGTGIGDGSVTPAKWTNPYCFRAYASSDTTLTDGSWVKINLATEDYDYNNNFATSTYTAPVAGVYHFDGSVVHASASVTPLFMATGIYKNGAIAIMGNRTVGSAGFGFSSIVSGDLLLAANDTIELHHYQDSAGNETTATVASSTYLTGHLVHQVI